MDPCDISKDQHYRSKKGSNAEFLNIQMWQTLKPELRQALVQLSLRTSSAGAWHKKKKWYPSDFLAPSNILKKTNKQTNKQTKTPITTGKSGIVISPQRVQGDDLLVN